MVLCYPESKCPEIDERHLSVAETRFKPQTKQCLWSRVVLYSAAGKAERLEQIRYDELDLIGKGEEGASISRSKKHWVHLAARLTVLGLVCHSLFPDAGEAQRLCWRLCSFPHSSSRFILFYIHLKTGLFLSLWAAETTMLIWGLAGINLVLLNCSPLHSPRSRREQKVIIRAEQAKRHDRLFIR